MRVCPFCAETIQDAAIVCKHCGRDVASTVVAPAAPAAPRRGPSRPLIVVLCLCGIAGLAFIALLVGSIANVQNTGAGSSDDARARALHAAIVGVGESCDEVTRVFHQGSGSVGDFWNAECRDGRTYSIRQQSSGEVQVLSCAMMRAVAQTNCFVPFSK